MPFSVGIGKILTMVIQKSHFAIIVVLVSAVFSITPLWGTPAKRGSVTLEGRILSHIGGNPAGAYLAVSLFDPKNQLIKIVTLPTQKEGSFKVAIPLDSEDIHRVEAGILNPNVVLDRNITNGVVAKSKLGERGWTNGVPGSDLLAIEGNEGGAGFSVEGCLLRHLSEKGYRDSAHLNLGRIKVIFDSKKEAGKGDSGKFVDFFNQLQQAK